jgi:hypothetical protein
VRLGRNVLPTSRMAVPLVLGDPDLAGLYSHHLRFCRLLVSCCRQLVAVDQALPLRGWGSWDATHCSRNEVLVCEEGGTKMDLWEKSSITLDSQGTGV